MATRRIARAQDLIKEEVSRILLFKVKDPRLGAVTTTRVEMTPDLKRAVVFYTLLGIDVDPKEVQAGLSRAVGYIRREVARSVDLKYVPEIHFEYDAELEQARHMENVLRSIAKPTGVDSDE